MRRSLVWIVTFAVLLVGCSSSDKASSPWATNPFLTDYGSWMREAPIAVVADLIDAGANGRVAIHPTVWLRGSLPVDSNGWYRFEWDQAPDTRPGVWLFDADGLPFTNGVPSSYIVYPTRNEAMYEVFPVETAAEQRRVLGEADLVIEARERRVDLTEPAGSWTFDVLRVMHGDSTVSAGDQVVVRLPVDNDGDGIPQPAELWALRRVGDAWEPLSTWLPLPSSCIYFAAIAVEMFPGYDSCSET